MATLTLQNWHADDSGAPRAGATVTYKAASESEPNANPVLGTTTTNASGKWAFTGVTDGDYDVYLVDGATTRFWKGLAALPLTFTRAPASPVLNALVNGDFSVWQRGVTFTSPALGAYTADRWQWFTAGAGDVTITRDTSVPTVGTNAINTTRSLKVDVTTADASIAAGDKYFLLQGIEGFDYRALTNGFTLSFWVKGAKTGVHCVGFVNGGSDRSYVAEYTINAANTWEYKTVVVPTPPTAGTWVYEANLGLQVIFTLAAGSTFQTTAGTWQTGLFYATASQVNELDNTANNFFLALVNIIPGATAAPLVPLPVEVQLARCQRYAIQLANGVTSERFGLGMNISTTQFSVGVPLPVQMLGAPSVTFSAAGTFAGVRIPVAVVAITAIVMVAPSPRTVTFVCDLTGLTAGNANQLLDLAGAASILLESNPV